MNRIKRVTAFIVLILMITELLPFNAFSKSISENSPNVYAEGTPTITLTATPTKTAVPTATSTKIATPTATGVVTTTRAATPAKAITPTVTGVAATPTVTGIVATPIKATTPTAKVVTATPMKVATPTSMEVTVTSTNIATPTATSTNTPVATSTILQATTISENITLTADITYEELTVTSGQINLNGFKLCIDGNLTILGGEVNVNYGNLIVNGNIKHMGGTIDINHGEILIRGDESKGLKGDLIQAGGTRNNDIITSYMNINHGRLEVAGDYLMEGINEKWNNYSYLWSYSYLKMVNPEDYVLVNGKFVAHSRNSQNGYLTAGTMEVKGDFEQSSSGYVGNEENFATSGTFKVKLSGNTIQNVSFQNPEKSHFNYLEISNTNPGVSFNTPIALNYLTEETNFSSNVSLYRLENPSTCDITINGNLTIVSGNYNLIGKTLTVNGDYIQYGGNFDVNYGNLIVNGNMKHMGGTIDINHGEILIRGDESKGLKGDLIQAGGRSEHNSNDIITSYMDINHGRLEVAGDYLMEGINEKWKIYSYLWSYSYLKMVNPEDYVLVNGKFVAHSRNSQNGYLTAGTMEVKGDFEQSSSGYVGNEENFAASGAHKVILSGSTLQNVYFQNSGPSKFNILIITKPLNKGYSTSTSHIVLGNS